MSSLTRGPRRRIFAVAAALLISALTAAAAQADGSAVTYDLLQGQVPIGETTIAVTRSEVGLVSESSVSIAAVIELTARLVTGPDGTAAGYHLEGSIQGVQVGIDAEFDAAGLDLDIVQAGSEMSLRIDSAEPLYVIDNNFIDGIQIAVWNALAVQAASVDLAIVVPQAGILGRLILERAANASEVEYRGATVSATRLDGSLEVAGQSVVMTIWVDETGSILVLDQPQNAIRFVRRPPVSEDAAVPTALSSAAALLDERAACVEERDVTVESTGETLAGVLTLPARPRAHDAVTGAPVVIMLPGSGAANIDGDAPPLITNSIYRQLAYSLGCSGYAVLRASKLGLPPSTGDANAVTIETYARNTADWMAALATQPGVDGRRVGLIGHSEGGLVALAAVASGLVAPQAVVLLAAPGRTMGEIITAQMEASVLRSGGNEAQVAEVLEQTRAALEAILTVEGVRLELTGDLATNQIAALFAPAAGLLRSQLELDPAVLIRIIDRLEDVDVVIVQGLEDVQVLEADARRLAESAPDATLLLMPSLAHNLYDVAPPISNALLPGSDTPLSDTLLRSLVTLLDGHLRTARR